jgi:outer membrane protein assembly factor BamB
VGGTLVVGSETGIIVGLDPDSGAERWRAQGSGGSASHTPASDGERAYVFFAGGEIIAFDGANGAIKWRAGITQASPGQFFQPSADVDRIYASGVNGFYALRKD